MGAFIMGLLNFVRLVVLLFLCYFAYGIYVGFQRFAEESQIEALSLEARAQASKQNDVKRYGRVLSDSERLQRALLDGLFSGADNAIANIRSVIPEQVKVLQVPPASSSLDTVMPGDTVNNVDKYVKNFLPLALVDPLQHTDFAKLVIGRVSIPEQEFLPKGFTSSMPVAFFVGVDGKKVTNKVYMLADCKNKVQTDDHQLWFADNYDNFKWSKAYNAMYNYSYAVAHQACWMAYPTSVQVQTLIDFE